MQNSRKPTLPRVLTLLVGVLILKVTVSVLLGYGDYFPPNFAVDFLRGREDYFYSAYWWAFYAASADAAGTARSFLGLILISERFRLQFPQWHRRLGKTQIALILLLLTPSGLWMAGYAMTGIVAAIGFSLLAVVTAACAVLGWRAAVQRRFADHRRWMLRCYLLLCSAVVLRLIGGLASVTAIGGEWSYPLAAWTSWLVPLTIFELGGVMKRRTRRQTSRGALVPSVR